ncbi:uncharacterized protein LOC115242354 [Formica exsecta]|uniref:uncharacterized protein LOC115242354 n=1 Tax=Formica exsecta TaxID=72781 RepID=UPI0011449886|nr:uncharacterized protein LOC115242354 [Formica exsecta]
MLGRRKDIRDYSKSHERLLIKRAASKTITAELRRNRRVAVKYNTVLENVETIVHKFFRDSGLSTSIIQSNNFDRKQYSLTTLQTTHATCNKSSEDINFLTTRRAFLLSDIQSDDDPENSEESCNEDENAENDICRDIALWAVHDGITHASLERLLQLLRKSNRYPQLPAKANALLGNPTNGLIRSVEPGYYWHNDLKTCLEKLSEEICSDETLKTLLLSINIDGIPLFKSSGSSLYTILGSFPCSQIFLIGCYHGHKKLQDFNDFLKDFVDETIDLITTGYNCRGKIYNIKIHKLFVTFQRKQLS